MSAIRVDDRSGRYDDAPEALLATLKSSSLAVDAVLMTEMTAKARQAVLDKIPGFSKLQDIAHGDASEIAMLYRTSAFKVLHFEAAVLGPDLGPGGREIAGIAVLEDRSGHRTLVGKAHLPASVESDFFTSDRGKAHRVCVQHYRARVNALTAQFKPDAVLVYADWNLDLHKAWVQKWIKQAWPELALPTKIFAKGTHEGGRLIDWYLWSGLTDASWRPLPMTDASDHRGTRLFADFAPKETPVSTIAPPNPPYIPAAHHGGDNSPILAIVMHGAVSPDDAGTARKVANDFATTSVAKSAHYIVDPKETIQSVWDHVVAYHCGHNTHTIGVEMCDEEKGPASRWQDADSLAIISRAAKLVARLCLVYNIEIVRPTVAELKAKGPHGIYGHNDSRLAFGGTTHTDPIDFPWDKFLSQVKAEAAKLKGEPTVTPAPAPASTPNITAFHKATTDAERRKYAALIVQHGAPKAAAAAKAWLNAADAKRNAYKAVIAEEK